MSIIRTINKDVVRSAMDTLGKNLRERQRNERARRRQARADAKAKMRLSFRDRLRAANIRTAQQTAQQAVRPADELASAIPDVDANNAIDNTVATSEITSSMPLDPVDTMVRPAAPVQPVMQPQAPTYGVAGAAQAMFGTPEERQISMGSSLMKRACKYKNKK
tara:strand:+ start:132 stop:620 length:489 start_codon:yes stop_codon:yes gene_type:complete